MEENKLVMVFKNTLGNSFSITVDDPKDNLGEQEIIDAMNLIKSKNILAQEIISSIRALFSAALLSGRAPKVHKAGHTL